MDWILSALGLVGGVCVFLFGMNVMGESLERRAGTALKTLLGKLTNNRILGFLTGMVVTSVIQSSSATTVMVVGFVNSGLMGLPQAISVIMGSNIGTTITAWILSTNAISGTGFLEFLKPDAWMPLLALIGIVFTMFLKGDKKKDTGSILLGFSVLMTGMSVMSGAVSSLKNEPAFVNMFARFQNPFLCTAVGAVLTGVIQSSSASVGILQSLAGDGLVNYNMAIPIIMGQNIGTCVTALIASAGANKNAKRTAFVHLSFNLIGAIICLTAFCIVKWGFNPSILYKYPDEVGIATCHSLFNIITTAILLPCAGLLAKFACIVIKDKNVKEEVVLLDEKLIEVPAIALQRSKDLAIELAGLSASTLKTSLTLLDKFDEDVAKQVKENENKTDYYEDILGKYLVKLSSTQIGEQESLEVSKLLKAINDFERIGDHSMNVLDSAQELKEKGLSFSDNAKKELSVLTRALDRILDMTVEAFTNSDLTIAENIEPLEEVIDKLKEQMRARHVERMQKQKCSIEVGFVWVDLLTSLERVSDHCSNIAIGVIDNLKHRINSHEFTHNVKKEQEFKAKFANYLKEFNINVEL